MEKTLGRPSGYTKKIAEKICERVAGGENLNRLCEEDGMPSRSMVYRWLDENEAFRDEYARARERRADSRSDRIDDYKIDVIKGTLTPEQARVVIDVEKWQAGKENPRKYAEKTSVEAQITVRGLQATTDFLKEIAEAGTSAD